jgi:hypothetical protein
MHAAPNTHPPTPPYTHSHTHSLTHIHTRTYLLSCTRIVSWRWVRCRHAPRVHRATAAKAMGAAAHIVDVVDTVTASSSSTTTTTTTNTAAKTTSVVAAAALVGTSEAAAKSAGGRLFGEALVGGCSTLLVDGGRCGEEELGELRCGTVNE